jgi:purine-cytosine permease-like protein
MDYKMNARRFRNISAWLWSFFGVSLVAFILLFVFGLITTVNGDIPSGVVEVCCGGLCFFAAMIFLAFAIWTMNYSHLYKVASMPKTPSCEAQINKRFGPNFHEKSAK